MSHKMIPHSPEAILVGTWSMLPTLPTAGTLTLALGSP